MSNKDVGKQLKGALSSVQLIANELDNTKEISEAEKILKDIERLNKAKTLGDQLKILAKIQKKAKKNKWHELIVAIAQLIASVALIIVNAGAAGSAITLPLAAVAAFAKRIKALAANATSAPSTDPNTTSTALEGALASLFEQQLKAVKAL